MSILNFNEFVNEGLFKSKDKKPDDIEVIFKSKLPQNKLKEIAQEFINAETLYKKFAALGDYFLAYEVILSKLKNTDLEKNFYGILIAKNYDDEYVGSQKMLSAYKKHFSKEIKDLFGFEPSFRRNAPLVTVSVDKSDL